MKRLGCAFSLVLLFFNSWGQVIPDGTYEYRDTTYGEMTAVETVERFVFSGGEYYSYDKRINHIKGTPTRSPQRPLKIMKDTSNRGTFVVKGGYMYLEDISQVGSMFVDSSNSESDSITLTFDPRTSENCAPVTASWIILTEILPDKTDNFLKKLAWDNKKELPFTVTIAKPKGYLYIKIVPPDYAWFEMTLRATKNMRLHSYHKINRDGDAPKAMVVRKVTKAGIVLQHVHHKSARLYKKKG